MLTPVSPLQSKLFLSSIKTYEEKLKITLLGSCENFQDQDRSLIPTR